jgi:4-diphosphocytidyl-2-C-methyl-D-erythritol kinase
LLCGSGSSTFAICDSHDIASAIVVEARKRGVWARATSFGSMRAVVIDQEGGAR